MKQELFWIGLLLILCVKCQPAPPIKLQPVVLKKFQIFLFSEDQILSTVIWLQPPFCLYEEWMMKTIDPSVATRNSSSIQVEVQIKEQNETFVVPEMFSVPQCKTLFGESPPTEAYVFQVGPNLNDQSNTKVTRILPGVVYIVRYVLYNNATKLAQTNWSQPFKTRDLLQSPREMLASLQGRSGGMVVITVLLSISMFLLLVGIAVTFATHK
ncbi:uroplakin-2-like [Pyxicephalus adspersus]|uniref:uroplakin-2-like n=1 Tax=Pyxicephalus adspersus TaxID=30357 RepID=UPI003B5A4A82